MLKYISLFLINFIALSCNQQETVQRHVHIRDKNAKYYFDYDSIIHYQSMIAGKELKRCYLGHPDNSGATAFDSLKSKVLLGNIPSGLNDTAFIEQLPALGYRRLVIEPYNFKKFDHIFQTRVREKYEVAGCSSIFRDLIIFKKRNKITGIARLCLGCGAHQLYGTLTNTDDFGSTEDYDDLRTLLQPY